MYYCPHCIQKDEISSRFRCDQHTLDGCLSTMDFIESQTFNKGKGIYWNYLGTFSLQQYNSFSYFLRHLAKSHSGMSPFSLYSLPRDFDLQPFILSLLIPAQNQSVSILDNVKFNYFIKPVRNGKEPSVPYQSPLITSVSSIARQYTIRYLAVIVSIDRYNFITCDGIQLLHSPYTLYVRPLAAFVWAGIFLSSLLVAVLLSVFSESKTKSSWTIVFIVLAPLVDQFPSNIEELTHSSRRGKKSILKIMIALLSITWICSCFILTNCYKRSILSILTAKQELFTRNSDLRDLVGYTIYSSDMSNIFEHEFSPTHQPASNSFHIYYADWILRNDPSEKYVPKSLARLNVRPLLTRKATGYELLSNCNKTAWIVKHSLADLEIEKGNKIAARWRGNNSLKVKAPIGFVKGVGGFDPYFDVWFIKSHFKNYLATRLNWILESGIYRLWTVWKNRQESLFQDMDLRSKPRFKPIDLNEQAISLFCVCLAGNLIALVCFACENICRKGKKTEKVSIAIHVHSPKY